MKAIEVFEPYFFWDCQKEKIDLENDAEFVVERVLAYSLNEYETINLEKLITIYSIDFVREVAKNSTQIFGNERIELISKRIGVDPTEMNRYIPPCFL